jgi:predicted MFS family arabinose efflux permease
VLIPLAEPGAGIALFVLAWLILGYGSTLYNITQVSYRQAVCPDTMLGRINAANRFLAWGTPPIGALLAGLLAEHAGLRSTLWVAGSGLIAGTGWLLASALRHPTTTAPAAAGAPAG